MSTSEIEKVGTVRSFTGTSTRELAVRLAGVDRADEATRVLGKQIERGVPQGMSYDGAADAFTVQCAPGDDWESTLADAEGIACHILGDLFHDGGALEALRDHGLVQD